MKTDLSPGNASLCWTTTFFRQLQRLGVRHIVISPGSRSTPLTLAAAANEHFEKHIILDERSAAFTALGIGKATNIPAVLICTSGTAPANYYPAVIEARMSGIPLILATADRPPSLRATGANQAINQLKLFGDYPVFYHEVGEPRMEDADLNRLRLLGKQAFTMARNKRGPVHLNFPFRKPLEPDSDYLTQTVSENAELSLDIARTISPAPALNLPEDLTAALSKAQKPLIIVGPLAPQDDTDSIVRLAEQIGAPILSETSIESDHSITGFDGFLRNGDWCTSLRPDLILRFGFQPITKGLELALRHWPTKFHYHFASTSDWQDATLSDAIHIEWKGKTLNTSNISPSTDEKWLSRWKEIEQEFQTYYDNALQEESVLTDGTVYHHLCPQIADDFFVAASNSFPARDIHLFGEISLDAFLFQNRGASGIDGVTSTALGLSLALKKPGVLFTGDLAFLHDTNALLNHDKLSQPLVVVVINNAGGSIFRMLPVEQHVDFFEPYFETPQNAHISKLVQSYEIPYHRICSLQQLQEFSLSAWTEKNPGLTVIECQTSADASMQLRKKLWSF